MKQELPLIFKKTDKIDCNDIPGFRNEKGACVFNLYDFVNDERVKNFFDLHNIRLEEVLNKQSVNFKIFGDAPFCDNYNQMILEGYLPLVERKCLLGECCTLKNKYLGIKINTPSFIEALTKKISEVKDDIENKKNINKALKIINTTGNLGYVHSGFAPGIVGFDHLKHDIINIKKINDKNKTDQELKNRQNQNYYNDFNNLLKKKKLL